MLDTVSITNSWSNEKEHNLSIKFPLHRACRDGNVHQLKSLLEQLGNQLQNTELVNNEEEDYKWTAAHFASYFGNVECLQLLHQAVVAYNGVRVGQGMPEIKSPLVSLSSQCQQTPLQVASFANHPLCVEWLVKQAGVPINCQDSSGETALHKACRSGALEVVKILSTCDTNPSIRNNQGLTAAEVAAVSGNMSIATLITGRAVVNPTSIISGSGYYGYLATPLKKPGCDLLSSDALARDEVPIAGKKRGRCNEEETETLSKRARMGDIEDHVKRKFIPAENIPPPKFHHKTLQENINTLTLLQSHGTPLQKTNKRISISSNQHLCKDRKHWKIGRRALSEVTNCVPLNNVSVSCPVETFQPRGVTPCLHDSDIEDLFYHTHGSMSYLHERQDLI